MKPAMSKIASIVVLGATLIACSSTPKPALSPAQSETTVSRTASSGSSSPLGIGSVEMTTAINHATGAAQNPAQTFTASKVRTIIAVLALENLPAGTMLSYIRYLNNKLVNSKTAKLTRRSKYFYFQFNARPGKMFAKGHYLLRLYVNGHSATQISYDIN